MKARLHRAPAHLALRPQPLPRRHLRIRGRPARGRIPPARYPRKTEGRHDPSPHEVGPGQAIGGGRNGHPQGLGSSQCAPWAPRDPPTSPQPGAPPKPPKNRGPPRRPREPGATIVGSKHSSLPHRRPVERPGPPPYLQLRGTPLTSPTTRANVPAPPEPSVGQCKRFFGRPHPNGSSPQSRPTSVPDPPARIRQTGGPHGQHGRNPCSKGQMGQRVSPNGPFGPAQRRRKGRSPVRRCPTFLQHGQEPVTQRNLKLSSAFRCKQVEDIRSSPRRVHSEVVKSVRI